MSQVEILEGAEEWRDRYARWKQINELRGDEVGEHYPWVANRRAPFRPARRALPMLNLALVTSAGAYLDGTEPELARVEGARLLPLSLFNEWAPTLDPERPTVFICHHGIRSAQVCAYLSRQGFEKTYNLSGGIDRWSAEVDPSIPRY